MSQLADEPSPGVVQEIERWDLYADLMLNYTDDTMDGQYGNTVKFWMIHIKLINIQHRFTLQ